MNIDGAIPVEVARDGLDDGLGESHGEIGGPLVHAAGVVGRQDNGDLLIRVIEPEIEAHVIVDTPCSLLDQISLLQRIEVAVLLHRRRIVGLECKEVVLFEVCADPLPAYVNIPRGHGLGIGALQIPRPLRSKGRAPAVEVLRPMRISVAIFFVVEEVTREQHLVRIARLGDGVAFFENRRQDEERAAVGLLPMGPAGGRRRMQRRHGEQPKLVVVCRIQVDRSLVGPAPIARPPRGVDADVGVGDGIAVPMGVGAFLGGEAGRDDGRQDHRCDNPRGWSLHCGISSSFCSCHGWGLCPGAFRRASKPRGWRPDAWTFVRVVRATTPPLRID
ncbi:MAG: hypothetical protein MUC88_24240 [Planctomycetes bacterium]|nr:hypothetical protein [Planctomycetota bacterium]